MKNNIYKKITLFCLSLLMLMIPMIFASALTSISQGTTKNFAILSGSTITNTGPTVVSGDIGLYPGTSFTNKEGVTITGTIHLTDAVAGTAKDDLTTAYNQVSGLLPVTRIASQLGGQTLLPGVYDSADGKFQITGTLTLNAAGDPNAVFVFKAESTLITASSSNVNLINDAQHCNVYWKVGSSATFGTDSYFVGRVYALTSITANTGAEFDGQLLAMNGAVTLDTNKITNVFCSVTETVNGGDLPNTASNEFPILYVGISLIVVGLFSLVFRKQNVKNNK